MCRSTGVCQEAPLRSELVLDGILEARGDHPIAAAEEVVSSAAFGSLVAGLPGHAGLLSSDARVTSGSTCYTAAEQKVALLWKSSVASLVSARVGS